MLAIRYDMTFKPCNENLKWKIINSAAPFLDPMQTEHVRKIYKFVRKKMQSSADPDTFWSYNLCNKISSSIVIVQIYSNKTTTALDVDAIEAYPVRFVHMNLTKNIHF